MNAAGKKQKKPNINEADLKACTSANQERIKTTPRKLTSSPIFPSSLPDDYDNIDVVWDWYSPTSKPRLHKPKVKMQQSPKLLIKRHPSNDQISVFNKLEEELKTVANTTVTKLNVIDEKIRPDLERRDHLDIFNDSLDEELIMASQKVENSVLQDQCVSKKKLPIKLPTDEKSSYKFEHDKCNSYIIGNDSFDNMFATIKDEDLNLHCNNGEQSKTIVIPFTKDSPIKCSPEEIEQKRLQALERRKAKNLQDTIERNRQEALKRLELSKKRRKLQN